MVAREKGRDGRGGSGGGWRGEEAVSARGGRGGRRRDLAREARGADAGGSRGGVRARASRDRAMPVAARYRPARGLPAGDRPARESDDQEGGSGRDATGGCPRARHRAGEESAPSSRRRERHVPGTSGGSILSFASGAAGDAATSPPAEGAPARVSAASGVVPTGAGARGGDPGISPIAPRSVAIVTRERAPRRLRTVPTRPARRASSGAGFCELGRRPGGTTRCARVRPR